MEAQGLKRKYIWFNLDREDHLAQWLIANEIDFVNEVRALLVAKANKANPSQLTVFIGGEET